MKNEITDIREARKTVNASYVLRDVLRNHGNDPKSDACDGCQWWPRLMGCHETCELFGRYNGKIDKQIFNVMG